MRRIRILLLVAAVASTGIFGYYVKNVYLKRDLVGPDIIARTDSIVVHVDDNEKKLCKDLQAVDAENGDVSDTLMVESIRYMKDKTWLVTYGACDWSHNVSKFATLVECADYTPPKFAIEEKLRFPVGTSDRKILEHITAEDCLDGDISGKIDLTSQNEESSDLEGLYEYTLSVTNSIEHTTELPISVEFYTDTYESRIHYPNILLSQYLVYVPVGQDFLPKMYLDHLELNNNYYVFSSTTGQKEINGSIDDAFQTKMVDGTNIAGAIHLSAIRMDSNVNTRVPGIYKVTFSCVTEDGYFGSTQMTVVVE